MRCKKHPADVSSSVGVCASCLRQRLYAIIAAQAQAQALKQAQAQQDCRKSEPEPPLSFPRSVSPYISRRKSDTAATWRPQVHHQRFFSTPQVGPSGSITVEIDGDRKRKGGGLSSLFFGLFRSKSDKSGSGPGPIPDHGVSVSSCSVSSPSWFSTNFIAGRRKKKSWTFSIGEGKSGAQQRRIGKDRDRGMSPARCSDDEDQGGSSGYSSESSHGWKQTPRRTPASVRRCGGKAAAQSKNVSSLKFCLSPLVRASPGRHWNQKGLTSEMVVAGESRVPAKPYLSAAASFCKNRSRKLADFGRYN
ncbi:hypothetical protein PHJA_001248100 [Phtheirospermum japonicum]|uniref:Uncharacterized protein n=1 Tax=Phtheirospermum japonicum TaxID=374723 RepID=A0A830C9Y3_9LAMI|nr:hypothetical protein PHJA_001248100 [Phtheirospermum japonicum]